MQRLLTLLYLIPGHYVTIHYDMPFCYVFPASKTVKAIVMLYDNFNLNCSWLLYWYDVLIDCVHSAYIRKMDDPYLGNLVGMEF